jgi:uncharacterized membrane protein
VRKLTFHLLRLLFLPKGSLNLYLDAAHKASRKHLAKWALLATMVFLLAAEGTAVYLAWLLTTLVFATYQYLYVFSYPIQRPVLYEETSLAGILLVAVNHIAVALLCGVGWIGFLLHTYSGYYLLRVVGRLAIARETRKIFSEVCRDYPSESLEKRVELANSLLENRVEDVQAY